MRYVDHGKRMIWVTLLILVLLGLGLYQGRSLYRELKRHRALKVIEEVRSLAADNQLDAAATKMQIAFGLAPKEPEVLRLAAQMGSRDLSPEALESWKMLMNTSAATFQDRLEFSQYLLQMQRFDLLRQQLVELAADNNDHPEVLTISFLLLVQEKRVDEALKVAAYRVQLFPDDDQALFDYGQLLLQQSTADERDRGATMLWTVATNPGPIRNRALAALTEYSQLLPNQKKLLLRLIQDHAAEDLALRLAGLELQLSIDTTFTLDAAVDQILSWQLPTRPMEDQAIVADWLLRMQRPDSVLNFLSEPDPSLHHLLLQRYVVALIKSNRWAKASQVLEDSEIPLHPVFREVARATVAQQNRDSKAVAGYLNAAVVAAQDNPELVYFVAQIAESLNHPLVAVEALQRILADPLQTSRAARQIFRLLAPLQESLPLLSVLDQLARVKPNNPEVLNEQAWWHLVVQGSQDKYQLQAEKLNREFPNDPLFAATHALAHLLRDDTEQAFTVLDPWNDAVHEAPSRVRLVYAATLGKAGQREAARRLTRTLPEKSLKDRERDLLAAWR